MTVNAPEFAYHVFFSGQVQGVGFRWRAHQLAAAHGIRGWVRNLPDGRVELTAEGERTQVEAYLAALRRELADYIRDETGATVTPAGIAGFAIRY